MKPYFGGIPTDIDIQKLSEAYPIEKLIPGTMIPYADIAKVINQAYPSHRWRTVTMRWRKKVEVDHNVCIRPDKNELGAQFIVLNEDGKVDWSREQLASSVKRARRSYVLSARVDVTQLTDDKKKEHDFNCAKSAAVLASGQLRSKQPALPQV